MSDVTPGWKHAGIVAEGEAIELEGMNPWAHEWHRVHEPGITVAHPAYPLQRHRMWIYELRAGSQRVKFAAGEYSNGIWGFCLPIGSYRTRNSGDPESWS